MRATVGQMTGAAEASAFHNALDMQHRGSRRAAATLKTLRVR
ncbi:hypothetical protein [Mangrovibrevibacter kandeliae]|nr:hypothetical protein [Aurantimonas sp. CSK15Z-1]MCQ8780577.1 hypothetical protein [Aurantimonas sp. CSK15Z-1]